MWTDHLLFWVVLTWMLLLVVLAFFAVRALFRDEEEPVNASKPDPADSVSPADPPPPPSPKP